MNRIELTPEEIQQQVEAYRAIISNNCSNVQILMDGPQGQFWTSCDQESLIRYPFTTRIRIKPVERLTYYFTFGQCHVHSHNGKTLDKDIVVKITSPDPGATMVKYFGDKWGSEYHEQPDMLYYPRGIYVINE